jgi:hypothetical protein
MGGRWRTSDFCGHTNPNQRYNRRRIGNFESDGNAGWFEDTSPVTLAVCSTWAKNIGAINTTLADLVNHTVVKGGITSTNTYDNVYNVSYATKDLRPPGCFQASP